MNAPEDNVLRAARKAVLDGKHIPVEVAALLEARGIDVAALESRLIDNLRSPTGRRSPYIPVIGSRTRSRLRSERTTSGRRKTPRSREAKTKATLGASSRTSTGDRRTGTRPFVAANPYLTARSKCREA